MLLFCKSNNILDTSKKYYCIFSKYCIFEKNKFTKNDVLRSKKLHKRDF